MRYLVSVMLAVVAIIHFLPIAGAVGVERLDALYGVSIDEPNLAILMRHRAVLFGLLGAFLMTAAFRPGLQGIAFGAGLVSVFSFLYMAWSVGGYNTQIARIVIADIVAAGCLVIGVIAHLYVNRNG